MVWTMMVRWNVDIKPRCLLAGRVHRRGTTVPSLPTLVDMESQLVMHGESANNATALLADCGSI